MRPNDYERAVAGHFKSLGYTVEMTPCTNDYGLDVLATNAHEKIAVQAKMFGNSARKINRQMVLELHGTKDFFDCDRAIIATNGEVIENARLVANKLGIEILSIPADPKLYPPIDGAGDRSAFDDFWEEFIVPLEGETLYRNDGKSNTIVKVDWSGIKRLTSNNHTQTIKIEIFRITFNYLQKHGRITRRYINQEYAARASSGVVLILSNTPIIECTSNPVGLRLVAREQS